MSRTIDGAKLMPNVTLIVGVRFSARLDERVKDIARYGRHFTVVVDRIPLSGPIYLIEGLEDGNKVAQCHNCGKQSGYSKRVEVPRRWAHEHRCEPEDVRKRVRQCPVE